MKRLLLFLLAIPLWASNSLVGGSPLAISGTIPNTATYSAVGSFCMAGEVRGMNTANSGTVAGIYTTSDNGFSITYYADTDSFGVTGPGYTGSGAEGPSITIGTLASFRFLFERNLTDGQYHLRVWSNGASGTLYSADAMIYTTGNLDLRNKLFYIGGHSSLAAPFQPMITASISYVRMSAGACASLSAPPPKLLTSSFADLLDAELENDLDDDSGNSVPLAVTAGSATYDTTATGNPSVSVVYDATVEVGVVASVNMCSSFSNIDNTALTYLLAQDSGPSATLANTTNCATATATLSAFGTAHLTVEVTDASANVTEVAVPIGGTLENDDGTVDVLAESGDQATTEIINDLMASAKNPWEWKEELDLYIPAYRGAEIETYFSDWWNATPTGTIDLDAASYTAEIHGVNAQTTFCAGGTAVVQATESIAIAYPSPTMTGEENHAFIYVGGCPDATHITLTGEFYHMGAGTHTGLNFVVAPNLGIFNWFYVNTSIPGNYYDNVLAYYSFYYSTGIEANRDFARRLAQLFLESPVWNRGQNYTTDYGGRTHAAAGPARSQSIKGLILYAKDGHPEVWPALRELWDYWIYSAGQIATGGNMGSFRETAYITGGLSDCAMYDPDAGERALCGAAVTNLIDNAWIPLETTAPGGGGIWNWPEENGLNIAYTDADAYVIVTDGSTDVELFNSPCWQPGACAGAEYKIEYGWLWFLKDPPDTRFLPGNSTTAIGDPVTYQGNWVNDTHITLTAAYNSGECPTGCMRGMTTGDYAGLGRLEYMLGIGGAELGEAHRYYTSIGDTTRANQVKLMIRDIVRHLRTDGYDSDLHAVHSSSGWIHCDLVTAANLPCVGAVAYTHEVIKAFAIDYKLSRLPETLAAGNDLYHHVYGNPDYSAPYATTMDTFLADWLPWDPYHGYLNTPGATGNKWLGYCCGQGASNMWPSVRLLEPTTGTRRGMDGKVEPRGQIRF